MPEEGNDAQYIASRYDGIAVGPTLGYTFETQTSVPYDGSNKLARLLSPFTLRLIIPEALVESLGEGAPDVNLLGRASQDTNERTKQANRIRSGIGLSEVTGTDASDNLNDLRSTLSMGQALQSTLGTEGRAVLSDLTTVADIRYQVEKMLQVPPLTMFVNPNSLSISYTTVQQYTNRTRHGYIFERWGEGQPTLSISGSTGAFVAGNPTGTVGGIDGQNPVASGLQFAAKRDSAAFQQLMSLLHFYRNNGYIYDTVNGGEAHLFIGAVAIDYDQMTYIGNIDSFEYSYQGTTPHRIEWSMDFTVSRMYDHAVEPVVVAPQSTPTPGAGGLTDAELHRLVAETPTQNDIGTQNGVSISGIDTTTQGDTPLGVLGGYFVPTGLLGG